MKGEQSSRPRSFDEYCGIKRPFGSVSVENLVILSLVGAAKSLITIRCWWSSGFEMTAIGAIEGLVTYVIGIGLGRIGGAQ